MGTLSNSWMVVIFAVGGYSIFNAASIRVTDTERLFYAATVCVIALFYARDFLFTRKGAGVSKKVFLGVSMLGVFLIPSFLNEYSDTIYIVGDFVSLCLPILFYGLLLSDNSLVTSKSGLHLLILMLAISTLTAVLFGVANGTRFEPPSAIISCFLAYTLFNADSKRKKILALCGIIIIFALIFASGQRSAIILLLTSLLISIFMIRGVDKRIVTVLFFGLTTTIAALLFSDRLIYLLESSRFSSLLKFELDVSLNTRVNEVVDTLYYLNQNGQFYNWVLGFGHGATFESYASVNIRNYLESNRVHHIHIGPALILFRYGVVGVLIYLFFWYRLLTLLMKIRFKKVSPSVTILSMSCVLFLMDGFVRNVFVDPRTSLAIAVVFYASYRLSLRGPKHGKRFK